MRITMDAEELDCNTTGLEMRYEDDGISGSPEVGLAPEIIADNDEAGLFGGIFEPEDTIAANGPEIFRCETQMIKSYIRHEQTDPGTQTSRVVHAFSFCNHSNLPDDVIETMIRGLWTDLFGLTGRKGNSMGVEMPDKINFIDNSTSNVEKIVQPKDEPDNQCNNCDWNRLKDVTKYYLQKEMKRRD